MPQIAGKITRYTNLYVKRRLVKLEIDIFGIISDGFLNHVPKQKTMRKIKDLVRIVSVQIGLDPREENMLLLNAANSYSKMSRGSVVGLRKIERQAKSDKSLSPQQTQPLKREVMYSSIRANVQNNDLIKQANLVMYSYEFRMKHDQLYGNQGLIDVARTETLSPFFLCSSHPKPAKDHAAWEGKFYYDADWKQYVPDDQHDLIRAIIRNRRLRTIQWAAGEPVFLTTRRNCKHYFKNIPIEEVAHSSPKALLKRHKMFMDDDKPASPETLKYREYYNRLKIEEALADVIPNPKLNKDITKDKKLLDKWKKML